MLLTLRRRNEIFETLRAKGIDPNDCDLDTDESQLTHLPTGSFFQFSYYGAYQASWRVTDGPESEYGETPCKNWEDLLERLGYWADEVRYVNDTPDYWEELIRTREIMAEAELEEISNAAFTADEHAEIWQRMEEIKRRVRQVPELTPEQRSVIEQKLDDLADASERVGRRDWLVILYGTAFAMIVNDSVPAHVVQSVITMAIHGLAHVFGLGGLPPALPTVA